MALNSPVNPGAIVRVERLQRRVALDAESFPPW